jgi:hypothetical protein
MAEKRLIDVQPDAPNGGGGGGRDDRTNDFIVSSSAWPALPPKTFRIEKAQNGLRFLAADRGKVTPADGRLSGSVSYVVRWVQSLDITNNDSIIAARKRSIAVATIPASGIDGVEAAVFFSDPKFASGWFLCVGVDAAGAESDDASSPVQISNQILDDSVPPDISHPQASESSESHGDVTLSVLSCSVQLPSPLGSLDLVQPHYLNYPSFGVLSEGEGVRNNAPAGGTFQFQARNSLGRARGTGTITVTNGSTAVTGAGSLFTQQVNASGLIEVLGVQGTITTVNNDTSITLSAVWAGKTVTIDDFYLYPLITIYFVPVSKGGTRRSDVTNAPSVSTLFDGNDSPPNAPTVSATTKGNVIVIYITPVVGTRISHYNVYRGTGQNVAFGSCAIIGTVKDDPTNLAVPITFEDHDFTVYQRENGQFFTYYVTTVARATTPLESGHSILNNQNCRLNSGQDGDPTIPSRDGFKNVAFNGYLGGTGILTGGVPNVVNGDATDPSQDAFNNNPAIAPQTVAGLGGGASRLRAWTRWNYEQIGGATVYPTHVNTNEVKLPFPGAGKGVGINQFIVGWSGVIGAQTDKKIQKGEYLTIQVKVYCDSTPNGSLIIGVSQYNGGVSQWALLRTRQSNDTILESNASGPYSLAGSSLSGATSSALVMAYATYHLDSTFSTDKIALTVRHTDSTAGNIFIKELMVNEGYELAPWTGDMGNIDTSYPTAGNGGGPARDGPGDREGHHQV